jgi:DNA-binding transcriptional LysR family regulator
MELRHLRYFLMLAQELHFGRAAQRLHISQPPLSQQIRSLEKELGAPLFHRTKRKVQLTDAGVRFAEEARQILAQVDRAARAVSCISEDEPGSLIVGTLTAEKRIVIESIRAFSRRYPAVHVDLRGLGTAAQLEALHRGEIHVGFLIPPVEDPTLASETVAWEPLGIALPKGHPLAEHERVPLRALGTESSIMLQRALSPGYYDQIVEACRVAGFALQVVHEADNFYTALALVSAGLGFAFVPASIQGGSRKDVVFRRLRPSLPRVECSVVHDPENRSPVLSTFLSLIRSTAHGGGKRAGSEAASMLARVTNVGSTSFTVIRRSA